MSAAREVTVDVDSDEAQCSTSYCAGANGWGGPEYPTCEGCNANGTRTVTIPDSLIAALAAAGYHICAEGQGVVGGEVVGLERFGGQEVVVHHAPGFSDDGIASISDGRPFRYEPIPPEVGINGHVGTWTTVHPVFYAIPLPDTATEEASDG